MNIIQFKLLRIIPTAMAIQGKRRPDPHPLRKHGGAEAEVTHSKETPRSAGDRYDRSRGSKFQASELDNGPL
jgi:hypothetical protein